MSIQFFEAASPAFGEVAAERERCALIIEGLPLGYSTEEEHEILENFAHRAARLIRLGVKVVQSID